jgi:hypothetical protein
MKYQNANIDCKIETPETGINKPFEIHKNIQTTKQIHRRRNERRNTKNMDKYSYYTPIEKILKEEERKKLEKYEIWINSFQEQIKITKVNWKLSITHDEWIKHKQWKAKIPLKLR